MLHEAPILPSDDCSTAGGYYAFGEGHQLLQAKTRDACCMRYQDAAPA